MVTEMPRKLPKYVRLVKGTKLTYQRDYSADVKRLIGKKTFTYPLGVSFDGSDSALNAAILKASRAYELATKMALNSDPESFGLKELDLAALEVLRKSSLRVGQFAKELLPKEEIDRLHAAQENYENRFDIAENSLPDFQTVYAKTKLGEPLTFQEKAVNLAWSKLVDRAKASPLTLTQLWDEYLEEKRPSLNSREAVRDQGRWNRWIAIAGECSISSSTLEHIHDGLDRFVAERRTQVAPQSISRDLNPIVSAFRRASKKYRFGWVIEPPHVPLGRSKGKKVLTRPEQQELLSFCFNAKTERGLKLAALMLVMLQAGCMPSEVSRLDSNSINLDAEVPHLIIKGQTKTRKRQRIVPVVVGLDLMRSWLEDCVLWMQGVTESAHSIAVKKQLKVIFGDDRFTGHCMRHTFEANAISNNAQATHAAIIGGWSGQKIGFSDIMLDYGSDGLSQSELLQALYESNKVIHRHLLGV